MRRVLGRFDAPPPSGEALDGPVLRALEEDSAFDDRSTTPLPGARAERRARVLAREEGVLAGTLAFARAFELARDRLVPGAEVEVEGRGDGESFGDGEAVLAVRAPALVLLAAERTALNFLQRLSGVATTTRRCVEAAGGRLAVCDTRKTTPGLRALEKWAVVAGGGTSHRWSLGDMVLLKENHLALAGGIGPAVAAVRADPRSAALPLTIEVRTHEEAIEAARAGADRLLLDNMTTPRMARIAAELSRADERPELEASGNVTVERVPELARAGLDLVSLGSLTHSVRAVDFSFLLDADGA